MHDASCIGINCAHRFPKCFRSLLTLLGFSPGTSCHQFYCCDSTKFIQFLTCARILCEDSHCENGCCEVLSKHVKRRPSCPDTILNFGHFLLLECNQLALSISRFHFLSGFRFFEQRLLWLLRTFVFPGRILRPTFSVLSLNSYNISLKLFFGGCEQKHVVGEPQVCEAVVVVVTQVDSHSFFSSASAG